MRALDELPVYGDQVRRVGRTQAPADVVFDLTSDEDNRQAVAEPDASSTQDTQQKGDQ